MIRPPQLLRSGSQEASLELRGELVRSLFDNLLPVAIMSTTFVWVGLVVAMGTDRPWLWLLLAAGALAGMSRVGIILAYRYPDRGDPKGIDGLIGWERVYAAGSFAFAASLGLFAAIAVTTAGPSEQLLVVALLFGYGCGVVARVSARPWISTISVALATAPPVASFALAGATGSLLVGCVIAVFAIGGLETSRYMYRTLVLQFELRRELAGLARHDPLTGLPNRLYLQERLEDEVRRAARQKGCVALHFLDLDGFKAVNDKLGHPAGDRLLRAVADRISGLIRPGDLAARFGGDEFVVLQSSCGPAHDAELLARRLSRAIQVPLTIDGQEVRVGTSVGIAVYPGDASTAADLLTAADAALYRAKSHGRSRVVMASETALAS